LMVSPWRELVIPSLDDGLRRGAHHPVGGTNVG